MEKKLVKVLYLIFFFFILLYLLNILIAVIGQSVDREVTKIVEKVQEKVSHTFNKDKIFQELDRASKSKGLSKEDKAFIAEKLKIIYDRDIDEIINAIKGN
jgi:hypothetical protein